MHTKSRSEQAGAGAGLLAPAKLNLTLEILARRADGYHELESLVVFAGVGDRLQVEPAPDLTLEVKGPFAGALTGAGEENLVLRAARLLAAFGDVTAGARLRLTKNLPVGAGLGGGSSDAALALRLLNRQWGLSLPDRELANLGLQLGADVPVCLYRRPALMRGIGEELAPAPPLPPLWTVLVNPLKSLATADVYRARQGSFARASAWWRHPPMDAAAAAVHLAARPNDLQVPALRLCPDVAAVLSALERTRGCLLARMSGSGASCFGLYASAGEAEAAATALKSGFPEWWIRATAVLGEGEDDVEL